MVVNSKAVWGDSKRQKLSEMEDSMKRLKDECLSDCAAWPETDRDDNKQSNAVR